MKTLIAGLIIIFACFVPASASAHNECRNEKPVCFYEKDNLNQYPGMLVGDCFHVHWDTAGYIKLSGTSKSSTGNTDDKFNGNFQLHDGHVLVCPPSGGVWKYRFVATGTDFNSQREVVVLKTNILTLHAPVK